MNSFKLCVVGLLLSGVLVPHVKAEDNKGAQRRQDIEEVVVVAEKITLEAPKLEKNHYFNPLTKMWYYKKSERQKS